ncbi:tRNA (adenosine(37)-N6)-threonylcarbamoyltransferase complex dimerization subunit type 1 TsaB [Bdellovibrio sp. HCB337]|uniref:tRNA (adenosine(37)-N6)-threonylcarbamoyltransferase complex dimerization subunit type 1 TsaB n=1 Tax=Bdellovibrio sp. HCB337 TaxID=3394358 RepID=UPI0039A4165A
MIVLAMETSTQLGGVAVVKDGQILAMESSLRQKSHSEALNRFVENCLDKAQLKLTDIDVFAVGQGPGSFTGIRVAANAGKTFSYVYNKPLVTIDSLMLLAAPVKASTPVLSIINAYKNMVYLGLFDLSKGPEPVYMHGPAAVPVQKLGGLITQDVIVVGDGYDTYQEYLPEDLKKRLHRDSTYSDFPLSETLGMMAEKRALNGQTMEWNSFVPLYIRASEAEETKKGIVISPLK